MEVCAFTADGAGFRPSWWAGGGGVTKAGWLGMQPLALRSLREARAAAVWSLSRLGKAAIFLIV